MTTKRFVATCAVGFLVTQVLAILIHGIVLRSDYEPFYGSLLRPMSTTADWRMLLLPLSHLLFVTGFVWIVDRVAPERPRLSDALGFGLLAWMVGQAPLWLLWYAEQPWPGSLVVKQLVFELVAALVLSLVVTSMARRRVRARQMAAA
jgi:hypothetical protein